MGLVDFYLERDEDTLFFDLVIEDGQFKTVDNFDTGLQMSLYCDRRADESEVPIPQYRRGWWGNKVLSDVGFQIGSKLWLLNQARCNRDTLNKAIDFAQQACDWLVEDQHLQRVHVSGTFLGIDGIQLQADLTTITGQVESRYYDMWFNTQLRT